MAQDKKHKSVVYGAVITKSNDLHSIPLTCEHSFNRGLVVVVA